MDTECKAPLYSEPNNKSFLFLEPAARSPRLAITLTNIGWIIIEIAIEKIDFYVVLGEMTVSCLQILQPCFCRTTIS
jgi:hypothetical protein